MIDLGIGYVLICIIIMLAYGSSRAESCTASFYLLLMNGLHLANDEFVWPGYEVTIFIDYQTMYFCIAYLTSWFAYIANSKDFRSLYAYTVLTVVYFLTLFEVIITSYGLIDSFYYIVMYGCTLFLVWTVIYDRFRDGQRLLIDNMRKLIFSRIKNSGSHK